VSRSDFGNVTSVNGHPRENARAALSIAKIGLKFFFSAAIRLCTGVRFPSLKKISWGGKHPAREIFLGLSGLLSFPICLWQL